MLQPRRPLCAEAYAYYMHKERYVCPIALLCVCCCLTSSPVQALIQSGQTVPPALAALSSEFRVQCNMGLAQKTKRGGFGGKGFTFSITEKSRQQQQMQQAKKELSGANDFDEVEEVELLLQRDDFSPPTTNNNSQLALTNTMSTMDAAMAAAAAAAAARGGGAGATSGSLQSAVEAAAAKAALLVKHQLAGGDNITQPTSSTEGVARVKLIAKILKLQDAELAKRPPSTPPAPPEGLPPPGSEKTKLTADQQVPYTNTTLGATASCKLNVSVHVKSSMQLDHFNIFYVRINGAFDAVHHGTMGTCWVRPRRSFHRTDMRGGGAW